MEVLVFSQVKDNNFDYNYTPPTPLKRGAATIAVDRGSLKLSAQLCLTKNDNTAPAPLKRGAATIAHKYSC